MSLVSITLCILVMIDPDVSHFYLTCLGREELFRYKFCIELCFSFLLLKSNATFAPKKHVQLFSHFDILCLSVTTPLISTQSWVLVARSSKAPSGIQSGSTDIKSTPISPHSNLIWLVSGLWQIQLPSACYSSFQFSTGTSLSLGSPRIRSQVVKLLCK